MAEEQGHRSQGCVRCRGEDQPLILQNGANYHAAIYFDDPDGNSLEFITPLTSDDENVSYHDGMTLTEWLEANHL